MLEAAFAFFSPSHRPIPKIKRGMEVAPTGGEVKMFEGRHQELLSLVAPFESQEIR
jgi:hypothetical protein